MLPRIDQIIDPGKRIMLFPGWMAESGICTKSYRKMEETMSLFPPRDSSCFVSIPQNDLTICVRRESQNLKSQKKLHLLDAYRW